MTIKNDNKFASVITMVIVFIPKPKTSGINIPIMPHRNAGKKGEKCGFGIICLDILGMFKSRYMNTKAIKADAGPIVISPGIASAKLNLISSKRKIGDTKFI